MGQTRITKPKSWEKKQKEKAAVKAEEQETCIKEESDKLIDEIDALLEDQEALTNFRQRGGQ